MSVFDNTGHRLTLTGDITDPLAHVDEFIDSAFAGADPAALAALAEEQGTSITAILAQSLERIGHEIVRNPASLEGCYFEGVTDPENFGVDAEAAADAASEFHPLEVTALRR